MHKATWQQRLLAWFDRHRRAMPWRDLPEPYAVWISEVMLQQTQVEAVRPYFDRFMARFPNVATLAEATEEEVLKQWEGLGYYSRARNLHRAATTIMAGHQGQVPADHAALLALPGIGAYTAAAIASIAFGQPTACVDGNVLRVMARFRGSSADITRDTTRRATAAFLNRRLPTDRPGDFNQALMELGAMICRPRQPHCTACPLQRGCKARARGLTATLPVKARKAPIPHEHMAAARLTNARGELLIIKRASAGLLGGLWDLPGGHVEAGETAALALERAIRNLTGLRCRIAASLGTVTHTYSHLRVTLEVYACTPAGGRLRTRPPEGIVAMRWATPRARALLPFSGIARKALALMPPR